MSQEKSKTMPMQIFGGVKDVFRGIWAKTEYDVAIVGIRILHTTLAGAWLNSKILLRKKGVRITA